MVATLLVWLYTFFLCYVYGSLFFKLLRLTPPRRPFGEGDTPSAALLVVAGLVVVITLASFLSLFVQTGLFTNLLLLAGAMGAVLARAVPAPRRHPVFLVPLIVLFFALLLVLENTTHRPLNPDTNLYHAQAIHWIERFPAVPGLGNLHGRLAFNSSWFVGNALFSLAFLGLGSFHLTAGVLFLAVLAYFWEGFNDIARGAYSPAAMLKVFFFPVTFFLLGGEISSPGTDLPTSLLLWLLAVLWAEHAAERDQPFHPALMAVLAAFVVTIKFSAAPAVLLLILLPGKLLTAKLAKNTEILRQPGQNWAIANFLKPALCVALVLTPFLARNVVLSGYLLYPFPSIDLFPSSLLDWKIPLDRALDEQAAVMAWGRFPRVDAAQVLAMPFGEWFPRWLSDQTTNRQWIFWGALLSPLAAVPALWLARRSQAEWRSSGMIALGWLAFYAGTLFWLFSAPDFRFGYGFLIATIGLALAPWLAALLKRTIFRPSRVSAVMALMVIAYLAMAFYSSFEAQTFPSRLLLPAPYDRVATQRCELANGIVFCAKAYQACGYESFPCIPSPRPKVEIRGPGLGDGFRTLP